MGKVHGQVLKTTIVCLVALLLVLAPASVGAITWLTALTIGGTQMENIYGAANIPGGGYVAAGSTTSGDGDMAVPGFASMDAFLAGTSSTGRINWVTRAGGNANDCFNAVTAIGSAGFVAAGYTFSSTDDLAGIAKGAGDGLIVRFDAAGNKIATLVLGGNGLDMIESVRSTADGGFVVAGRSNSTDLGYGQTALGAYDAILARYDAVGTPVWVRQVGGSGNDHFMDVIETPAGELVAVGTSDSADGMFAGLNHGVEDAILVKFTAAGDVVWQKALGGEYTEAIHSITLAGTGFAVAGTTDSTNGDFAMMPIVAQQAFLAKYDLDGNQNWITVAGGSATDSFEGIAEKSDGSLVAFGYTSSTDGNALAHPMYGLECWIVEFSSAGLPGTAYSCGGSGNDMLFAGCWTSMNRYAGFGSTWSNDDMLAGKNNGLGDGMLLLVDIDIEPVDDTAPELTLTPSTTDPTDQDVTITATGTDNMWVRRITLPDSTFVMGDTATYVVSANGTYTFIAEDEAGNTTTKSITISNIDKAPKPVVLSVAPASTSIASGVTQLTVAVTTQNTAAGATVQLRLLNGSLQPLVPAITGIGTVGADGRATVVLTLPADLVPGAYVLAANVADSAMVNTATGLTVVAAPIPDTGAAEALVPVTAGALLLAAAGMLMSASMLAAGRRRKETAR